MADAAAENPARKKSCILLWMNGGPSQMDTFDLKPGHANGGPFKEIATSVPGIKISEHLPKIAKHMDKMALIRSMSTKEADHGRATYQMRTGHLPGGPVQYPTLGSLFSKELEQPGAELPNFVSIAPYRFFSPAAYGPGFLGPQYAPLVVGENQQSLIPIPGQQTANYEDALKVQDIDLPAGVDAERCRARVELLGEMQNDFLEKRSAVSAAEPPQRLPAGGDADALQPRPRRSTWTRSRRRCAIATAATCSARAVCWPGGWSSRACRSSRCRWPPSATWRSAGTRTSTTSTRVKRLSEVLDPGLGDADGRPEGQGPARFAP